MDLDGLESLRARELLEEAIIALTGLEIQVHRSVLSSGGVCPMARKVEHSGHRSGGEERISAASAMISFNEQSDRHATYVDWLSAALAGSERVGLLDTTLSGFVRIVTNPRIFPHPAAIAEALAFVDAVIGAVATAWPPSTAASRTVRGKLVAQDSALRANHIPDA